MQTLRTPNKHPTKKAQKNAISMRLHTKCITMISVKKQMHTFCRQCTHFVKTLSIQTGCRLALLRRQVLERGYRDAWNSSTHEAMTDELPHEASKNPGEGEQGEMHGTRDGTTQGKTTAGSTRAPLQGSMRVRGQGTGGKRRHGTGKVMPGQ